MDVRELAELIHGIKLSMWGKSGLSSELERNMYLAESLIANGVTVQECGSWIDSCEYACLHKCSACGGNAPEDLESGLDTKTNYCPHCGAKMMPQPPKGE